MASHLKLFDTIERTETRPAQNSESSFKYLNSTARSGFSYVRELLQIWFDNFDAPDDKRNKLWREFRLLDDKVHLSAFFELYLHALFRSLGYSVEIEPDWPTGRPDFLLTAQNGMSFLVEATALYVEEEFGGAKRREDTVIDYLDENLNIADFFLLLEINGLPDDNPPLRVLREFLDNWLAGLDADQVTEEALAVGELGFDRLPSTVWDYKDWSITFRALPKKPEARGLSGRRTIGSRFHDLSFVDSVSPIRSVLKRKYRKYGDLDVPYMLAVNIFDKSFDQIDLFNALFGEEVFSYDFESPEALVARRKPDGAWHELHGYQQRRMSGLCVFDGLRPTSVCAVRPMMWHHPAASYPLNPAMWLLDQQVPNMQTRRYESIQGISPWEILKLDCSDLPTW